jgi:prevent-host-death family protein
MAIMAMMTTVHVADLKNRLSHYLRRVKAGEEIVVRQRNTPIARIVPLPDLDSEEAALVAAGKLRPGEGPIPESFWSLPAPRVPLERVLRAVRAERDAGA